MKDEKQPLQKIIEPPYFSNWADLVFPKLANLMLPIFATFPSISPNKVTISSFFIYTIACFFLFTPFPYHLVLTAVLLPLAYIFDCVDGQLARTQKTSSPVGDYLDKVLDVLKIYIVTFSLAVTVYLQTGQIVYVF